MLDGCTDREEQKNEEKGRQGERKIRGTEQVAREVNDWRDVVVAAPETEKRGEGLASSVSEVCNSSERITRVW